MLSVAAFRRRMLGPDAPHSSTVIAHANRGEILKGKSSSFDRGLRRRSIKRESVFHGNDHYAVLDVCLRAFHAHDCVQLFLDAIGAERTRKSCDLNPVAWSGSECHKREPRDC